MRRWGVVHAIARWLRLKVDDTVAPSRHDSGEATQWAPIAVEGPAPLLEMYRDVLSKNGIPALLRSEGPGRGALGGAPTLARLLVPDRCAQQARELLDLDHADIDDRESGVLSERTRGDGER